MQFPALESITLANMDPTLASAALAALETNGVLAVAVLRNGRIAWASSALLAMFGLEPGTATGKAFIDLVTAEDRSALGKTLDQALGGTAPVAAFRGQRPDGGAFDGELAATPLALPNAGIAIAVRDVTEQRRAESQLSYFAFRDPLTELPNRALFFDCLHQSLVDARRHASSFAVMLGDLDGLKLVNDRYGHETGDALLQVAAKRLRAAARGGDTVARIGGDEFAALLTRAESRDDTSVVARRMLRAFEAPVVVAGQTCRIGISIGVAHYPRHGKDMDALVAHADAAMYAAKRAGGQRFEFATVRDVDVSGPLRLPLFAWSEAHVLGVPLMDTQHKGLATLINRLAEELKAGHDTEQIRKSFGALGQAAHNHFGEEEGLMMDLGLSATAERHRQDQSKLLLELASESSKIGDKSIALTLRHLHGWLSRHIDADRPYAAELLAHGSLRL